MDDLDEHVLDPGYFLLNRPASPTSSDELEFVEEELVLRNTPTPPPPQTPIDDRQCRICFSGHDEEAELGKLIRPCLCKGSVSYVHVKCLNDWRRASRNKSSYWACLQCGYRYHFARTRVAGLATNPFILITATILLFFVCTLVTGAIVSYFLPPSLSLSTMSATDYKSNSLLSAFFAEEDDDDFASQIFLYTPASAIHDVIEYALRSFLSGDAFAFVASLFGWQTQYPQPVTVRADVTGFKQTIRIVRPSANVVTAVAPSWVSGLARKFLVGLSTIGILSFINLLLSFSLLLPFQLGLRNVFRRGRRGTTKVGTALILAFVLIGIGRAMYTVYTLTRTLAGYLLLRAETAILEVTPDEEERVKTRNIFQLYVDRQRVRMRLWGNWTRALLRFDRVVWGEALRRVGRWGRGLVGAAPA